MQERREKYLGALLGLAIGDALGVGRIPVAIQEEKRKRSSSSSIELTWTGHTSMALCLTESLLSCKGFDPQDQMERYLRWQGEGYLSSSGKCIGIGQTTEAALSRYTCTGNPYAPPTAPGASDNCSLARLVAIPLLYARRPPLAIQRAADSSRTTNAASEAVDACRYLAGLLIGAVSGASKEEILSPLYSPYPALWKKSPLHPVIHAIAAGSFNQKPQCKAKAECSASDTLETALWAFSQSTSFNDGAMIAMEPGGDHRAIGAVYGQLAGCYYGAGSIPQQWRSIIPLREIIELFAVHLYDLAESGLVRE